MKWIIFSNQPPIERLARKKDPFQNSVKFVEEFLDWEYFCEEIISYCPFKVF